MVRRREILQTLGTATAAGILAGCQAIEFGDESDDDGAPVNPGGRVEFPTLTAARPSYRDWIPPQSVLDMEFAFSTNLSRARERHDALPASLYEDVTSWAGFRGYYGVPFEQMDGQLIAVDTGLVVTLGEFDPDSIRETLTSSGYEEEEATDGRINFYRDPERNARFAVGDRGVIQPIDQSVDDFFETARILFETAAGERPRRHEESEAFARFTEAFGWPLQSRLPRWLAEFSQLPAGLHQAVPESVREDVYFADGRYVTDGRLLTRYWLATPDDEQSHREIKRRLDERTLATAGADSDGPEAFAVRHHEGASEVAVIRNPEETGGGTDPVQVTLVGTVEAGTLVLEHRAGEPLPLDEVTIRWDGDEHEPTGTLYPGERRRFDAISVTRPVRVNYSPPNTNSTLLLLEVDG